MSFRELLQHTYGEKYGSIFILLHFPILRSTPIMHFGSGDFLSFSDFIHRSDRMVSQSAATNLTGVFLFFVFEVELDCEEGF